MTDSMTPQSATTPNTLAELPHDELIRYARRLGLGPMEETPRGELLRLIRQREELIDELDRDALLDIVVWARRPVRQSASKIQLVEVIAEVQWSRLEGLSQRGLEALARLRGITPSPGEDRDELGKRLDKAEGVWSMLRRRRRRWVAGLVAKALHTEEEQGEYRFLPEGKSAGRSEPTGRTESVRARIEEEGLVPGIARSLRGVADDYVAEKLDEIEARIDRKLDEIDQRLAEWRDREVANRLKILKLTLTISVLVALICLAYDLVTTPLFPEVDADQPHPPAVMRHEELGNEFPLEP
jgi:hypothetical protein